MAACSAAVSASAPPAGPSVQLRSATLLAPAEQSVIGTIERFEATARRLVLATKEGHVAFVLAKDVVVRLGSRVLPVGALATHHGRRAKVRYTQANGRRTAHWVVISSEAPRLAN
ncbi:MAG TPA: hypothetical protein VFX12_12765 [Vicinamibacterales bacterium]|nr:hypothetical protein [Vicinamibacterales bacterium]